MSIKKRILSGAAVNFAGMVMSAAAQIVSVPVLTSAWGVEQYGTWLMITTVPAYLALSDLGFASASTSDMTMQIARGQRAQARTTFQSVWMLVNLVSAALLLITIVVAVALPGLSNSTLWLSAYSSVLLLLVVYSALSLNARIALAGLRATENYAFGTMLNQLITLFEVSATLTIAGLGGSFFECAVGMVCMQIANVLIMFTALHYRVGWLQVGWSNASLSEVRRLWLPAVAAMAIPIALAVNLQGMVIVAGVFVSATAAATLASVRTVSRVAIQAVGAINRATMPELSAAGAKDDMHAFGKIVALNLASVALILVPGALLFGAIGDQVVEIWTRSKIHPAPSLVWLLAISMVAHGLWYYTSNLMLASNAHTKVTRLLTTVCLGAIAAAILAATYLGLLGIGLVLMLSEVACLIGVLRVAFQSGLITANNLEEALTLGFWRSRRSFK